MDADKRAYSAEEKEDANNAAETILQAIEQGQFFDTLMKQYFEDLDLANHPNGYIFGKGVIVQLFEDAAYALEVGVVSGIIESQYGYHGIEWEKKFTSTKVSLKDTYDHLKLFSEHELKQED